MLYSAVFVGRVAVVGVRFVESKDKMLNDLLRFADPLQKPFQLPITALIVLRGRGIGNSRLGPSNLSSREMEGDQECLAQSTRRADSL
jgi:hypothetical protein